MTLQNPHTRSVNQGPMNGLRAPKDDVMLNSLREGSKGWVAKGLMGLLVLSFAVWGVNDVFTGYSATAVAEVGGEPITVERYQLALDQKLQDLSQRTGQPLSRADARKYGIDVQTLSELVGLTAFDMGAKTEGLTVSDTVVGQNITSDQTFTGTFGKFDRQGFDLALQRMGITEKKFIDDRRKYMIRMQLNSAMEAGVAVPNSMMNAISAYQGETRTATYFVLPPASVGEIAAPDEATIEAYYKKAAIRFTEPETRDFSVMMLTPDDLSASITVSDEDLKAAYEARRAEFDIPERRVVEQIPFATEEAAMAADARLRKGEAVSTIVKELGLEMSDIQLGNVTRADMLSPALADAAFSLKAGEFSAPVKGPLGYATLHVTTITSAAPSTFENSKDKLKQMIASEKAHNDIYDVQNAIEDARAGGATLQDAAEKNNLKVTKFTGISAAGLNLEGDRPAGLPPYKDLLKSVYENQLGDQIPPGDTGEGGYYWVQIDNVTAPKLKPFADVKAEVVKLWTDETRKAKLAELAQSYVERGNKGETIDALATAAGRSALISPLIERSGQSETFSRLAVTRVFAVPQGGFTFGPVGFGDSMLVMQVTRIDLPEPDKTTDEYEAMDKTLTDALTTDLLTTMVAGYERTLGTEINTQLLNNLAAAESGQQ
ncbi:MAG: SurA N-terminal domain-containing protein [Parvibaculum sp.]|nr:SurA N-terminal domain-containing protein [Parvibaculum sp.]